MIMWLVPKMNEGESPYHLGMSLDEEVEDPSQDQQANRTPGRGVRIIQNSTLIGQEVQLSSFCPIRMSQKTNNNV